MSTQIRHPGVPIFTGQNAITDPLLGGSIGSAGAIQADNTITPEQRPTSSSSGAKCEGSHQAFLQIIAELIFVVVLSFTSQYSKNVEKVAIGLLFTMLVLYFITNGGAPAAKVANTFQQMLGQKPTN